MLRSLTISKCRDGMHPVSTIVRRLKPTVNKTPSLRDLPFDMDWLRNMSKHHKIQPL